MSKFHLGLTLILGLALTVSLTGWWKTRREMQALTASSEILRETMGDLIKVIAQKDTEIDRLKHSPCVTQKKARTNFRMGADYAQRIESTEASRVDQIAAK